VLRERVIGMPEVAAAPPVIVVPCYNEAQRLEPTRFVRLVDDGGIHLVFVDDGSTDVTPKLLTDLCGKSSCIDMVTLARNSGKAEAVRQGLLRGIEAGAAVVGYYDADMATPPRELLRLVSVLESDPSLACVMGARVMHLGSRIERSRVRHYLGRVYATLASWALDLPVYDTQCGAKVFRVNETLRAALVQPFRTRLSFDVDLLNRLLTGVSGAPALDESQIVEVPLHAWRHVRGSTLRIGDALAAFADLYVIGRENRRRRRQHDDDRRSRPDRWVSRPGLGDPDEGAARRETRA